MIIPIVAFGDAVLKKECKEIDKNYPKLDELIKNMFQTMDSASGVGLAAPQIGLPIRIFIIDSTIMLEDDEETNEVGLKEVFINAEIIEETGEEWAFEEGCLSIPDVREDVLRKPVVKLKYQTIEGEEKEEEFDGMTARVIQHEYDHIEGVLFTDHISAFKRQLLKGKLTNITKGKVNVHYRMKFPKRK